MRFPNGLRALNHRDYRLFFAGQMISLIGTWMQSVGQGWLIVELTDSAFKLGLISTLQFLPMLCLSLFAGALADRLPKRRTLVMTQTVLMGLALTLSALVWTGVVQYWHVAVMALLLGLVNTLDVPVRQSFTVEMVGGKEDLGNAIALNSALFNGARLLGPAAAGVLVAVWGPALAFMINGLSFMAVIAALLLMRVEGIPKARPRQAMWREVGEGLRYIYRTPVVFFLLSLLMTVSLFVINYQVLVTVLAKSVLNAGAQGYGLLMSSLGAGALVGAMILAFRSRTEPKVNSLVTAAVVLCTATASMYLVHNFYLACAGLFCMGFAQILFTADTNTSIQFLVPDELRGRVMSVYQLVFAGTVPFGSLMTGAIIERFGGSVGFLADGLLGLVGALALIAWWRTARRPGAQPSPAQQGA